MFLVVVMTIIAGATMIFLLRVKGLGFRIQGASMARDRKLRHDVCMSCPLFRGESHETGPPEFISPARTNHKLLTAPLKLV